jgi:hypothetical protein
MTVILAIILLGRNNPVMQGIYRVLADAVFFIPLPYILL